MSYVHKCLICLGKLTLIRYADSKRTVWKCTKCEYEEEISDDYEGESK